MLFSGTVGSASRGAEAHSPLNDCDTTDTAARKVRIVAIGGGSGSGKSYLAEYIAARLRAPVIALDAYYRDLSYLPLEERALRNFDHPSALDWPLLRRQLNQLHYGNRVEIPVYDFSTHTRTTAFRQTAAREFLVIEGIFALWDTEVRALLSAGVFIDYPDEGCLARRTARDVAERGRTPASVLDQYEQTVRPMYLEHVAPTRRHAHLVVSGDAPLEKSFEALMAQLDRGC